MTATLNKVEQAKLVKDGFDVLDDLLRYSQQGDYSAVPEEDLGMRFRWFGVYRQRPNDGHFMLRIRVPGGQVSSAQLRAMAEITDQHARGFSDITTRQDIQLHWVTLAALRPIFEKLASVGMSTQFACGDTPRNVVGCPLCGVGKQEIIDATEVIAAVNQMFIDGKHEFSNLPRKFKVALAGCPLHCHQPQINDVGLYGVRRANGETGYGLLVGGGLSSTPHYAQSLRVFVRSEQVVEVTRAVTHLFRDEGYRDRRTRARLKFLVADKGWEYVRGQIEKSLGYELERDESLLQPSAVHADHMGVGEQKDGRFYVGVPISRGRWTAANMHTLADLAEKFAQPHEGANGDGRPGGESGGRGRIRLTNKQNALILDVPKENVAGLTAALDAAGMAPVAHSLRSTLVSCTGIQFCNLSIVETKDRAARILQYLEEHTKLDTPLMISVTGCPNSFAQYQIADIGLMGCVVDDPTGRKDEKGKAVKVDAFHVYLGGCLGTDPRFGDLVAKKVPADQIQLAIEALINTYLKQRVDEDETFGQWVSRNQAADLEKVILAPVAAAHARVAAGA